MTESKHPPFSARNRGARAQIDNAFPESGRVGLIHLLIDLNDREYVQNWLGLSAELQRIARSEPDQDRNRAYQIVVHILKTISWEKVFDFCERLHSHLAREVTYFDRDAEETVVSIRRSDVQDYIADELNRLFLEENLAFEFSEGIVRRRGRRNTADQIASADLVLGDPRFSAARTHYNKALKYFRSVAQPDYENVVKEAVCAVESAAVILFPDAGSTLSDVLKVIAGSDTGKLPKTITKTFEGLYGFRNSGQGIAHGGSEGGSASKELAEYALSIAASQIVLLVDFAKTLEEDIPF